MFTCYLRVTFHIFLNGQLTCRLSGPSCPPLVQWHPYPLVPHDLSQPSVPTLQSHMLSFGLASLPSSPSCPPKPQHPLPSVLHAFLQPYILAVQSLMPTLSPASLPSSQSWNALPQPQHPYPPVPRSLLQPCIPWALQSYPPVPIAFLSPACAV